MIKVSSAQFTCLEQENAIISRLTTKILPLICKSIIQVPNNESVALEVMESNEYELTDDQSPVFSSSISFQMNKERNFLYFMFSE